jgi:hypothetical protein
MNLKETLQICAEAAHNKQKMVYFNQNNIDPDEKQRHVLLGHCFENARELSYELAQRQIKHQVVRGAIAVDALGNCPHWLIEEGERKLSDDINETISEYLLKADETGDIDPEIWNEIPHPETTTELPDEASHYWIKVDGTETQFDTDKRFAVDVAAEARDFIGEPHVYEGNPDQYYLQVPPESYVQPWERENDWTWNPRTPNLTIK